jgi:Domain of unknown function (DUF4184)
MPFTPSHAAAVLPLVGTRLSPAALVIGSVAPDLPYFLPLSVRGLTHSPLGIVTIDLAIGIVVFAAWIAFLRAPALDYSPNWLRQRIDPKPRWRAEQPGMAGVATTAALLVAALLIGITTHVVWDLFTHEGWFTDVAPAFNAMLGPAHIVVWLHLASSVVGAAIIAIWARRWVRRVPEDPDLRPSKLTDRARRTTWIVLVTLTILAALVTWLTSLALGYSAVDWGILFLASIFAISVSGAVLLVLCIIWHFSRRRKGNP